MESLGRGLAVAERGPPGDILVVDDTPANLRVLAELLGERGHRVRPVLSGEMALRAASVEVPDLVLLDVQMAGIDGYEVCRRLKADPKTSAVPVVFLSARHAVSGKVAAFEVGGVDYITKPFELDEVVARVEIQLELRRLQAALASEREKSDALLSRMLPASVAEELRQGRRPPGQRYEGVTILVCDIVGFTELANTRRPEAVFRLLDRLYTAFDGLRAAHGVFKVETVGDSYVAVSGLDERGEGDVGGIARLALAMVETVRSFDLEGSTLAIRIGIHRGDVVGGVVGSDLPRFCLFGGAMALAAKIEAASSPMKIHLSEAALRRLPPGRFVIEPRGVMHLPGTGELRTAFLCGLRGSDQPSASAKG